MLSSMLPRQYQKQQQPINQQQYQQNYGSNYHTQTRTQHQEFSLHRQGSHNHLQKQLSGQNSGYIAVGPSAASSTQQIRSVLSAPASNFSTYSSTLQALQSQTLQGGQNATSRPLHWPEAQNQRQAQQTLTSQPLVQQTLNHLGIPVQHMNSQIPRTAQVPNSRVNNNNVHQIAMNQLSNHQMTPGSIPNQAINLTNNVHPYQRSPSMPHPISAASPLVRASGSTSHLQTTNVYGNSSTMHSGVLRSQSYTQSSTSEAVEREKVHIRFEQKRQGPTPTTHKNIASNSTNATPPALGPPRKRNTSGFSDTSSNKEDGPEKVKTKLELDENTRVVIDDDIEIVGCKQAEVMSHIRADCPIHNFVQVDSVTRPAVPANEKYCSKCFCYICDTLAEQCKKWKDSACAHCNAHAKASCWKARRNMKKSPLMNMLTTEEITPNISAAGERSVQFIIKIREAYITYRTGIQCDFHQVPCDCNCHRDNKLKPEGCVNCKAVHDLRKRFNYDPVRQVIYALLDEIDKSFSDQPYPALVLFEALLSELCSHRPADFNHVTRMPSNPNVLCQCTTPQIMDERIEPALIRLFTLNEINKSFKDKFYSCVNNSIQPLQLKDVMKRFLTMRHWDDLLLRAVLSGQNTSGRAKSADNLRETMQIIEMRVQKLDKETRYYSIIRYLRVVKVFKPPKHFDGLPFQILIDRWILLYTAKLGRFRDVCIKLVESQNLLQNLSVTFTLELFTLLSGKNLPANTELTTSFENGTTTYNIAGANQTALIILFLIYVEMNQQAMADVKCYMWFANWVNERAVSSSNNTNVGTWIAEATQIVKISQRVVTYHDQVRGRQFEMNCKAFDHQVALFVCSLVVLRFSTRLESNLSYIEDFMNAFKNNDWVLFYLFSQQGLLSTGNHTVITWLTKYMEKSDCHVAQFSQEALALLIQKCSIVEMFGFFKNLLSGDWTKYTQPMRTSAVKMSAKLSIRFINEPSPPSLDVGSFLSKTLLKQIISMQLFLDKDLAPLCEIIGRAACVCGSITEISNYKKLFPPEIWRTKCPEIFAFFEQKFSRNQMTADEVIRFLSCAVKEDNRNSVKLIFSRFTEKHECMTKMGTMVMQEVINMLDSHEELGMRKQDIMIAYSKLCSHETLSWLICAKCSAKMPVGWMQVWLALERNGMKEFLQGLVQHTLHQFTSWMKELCIHEENDEKRLLACLDVFVTNVVTTLLTCRFPKDELKNVLLETRFFIANIRLRNDYMKIIHKSFPVEPVAPTSPVKAFAHLNNTSNAPKQPAQPLPSNQVQKISPPRPLTSPKSTPNAAHPYQSPPSDTTPKRPQVNKLPQPENLPKPQDVKSPPPPSPKGLLSPTPGSAPPSGVLSPTVCPQCGDVMTNSFKCSRCHARRNRDIKCPSCGQVNKDLKGYSCRFCYASLLTILASGESAALPENPTPTPEVHEKKKNKKKKKKRMERQASKEQQLEKMKSPPPSTQDPSSLNSSSELLSPVSEKKKLSNKIVLKKIKPQANDPGTDRHDFQVKKASVPWEKESERGKTKTHHPAPLKIRLNSKNFEKREEVKIRSVSSDVISAETSRLTDDSDEDDFTTSTNFYNKVRKPSFDSRKWNNCNSEPTPLPPKPRNYNATGSFSNKSPPFSQSESSTLTGPKIPPLILKRKMDEAALKSPEQKRTKAEPQQPPVKRMPSKGVSMSKKQRDILQRMKTGVKPKNTIISTPTSSFTPKPTPKSPSRNTEWEITRRRKPGPASRTSYYVINPKWRIPKYLKLPYTLDLPKVCRVHLSPFPPKIMRLIHEHQPNLNLTSLYA
uniref:Uncharacterized protein LOC100177267 n=1 Tax=Phallusia mammillata TaxID=59560 RepID=A0A6F9DHA7_9ASCI|nr:uncharacterized protein LOC100177267 [Phallusia mammillata]